MSKYIIGSCAMLFIIACASNNPVHQKKRYSYKKKVYKTDSILLQEYWTFFGESNGWKFAREIHKEDSLINYVIRSSILASDVSNLIVSDSLIAQNHYDADLDKPHLFRRILVEKLKERRDFGTEIIPIISFYYTYEPEIVGAGGIEIPGKTGNIVFYGSLATHIGIFEEGELIYLGNAYYDENIVRQSGTPAQDTLNPEQYPRLSSLPHDSEEVVAFNFSKEVIDSLVSMALKDYIERLEK